MISEKDGYTSPYIKILALEVLNTCLGYDFACNRFLNFDLSKLESIAAQPETGKEKDGKEKKKRSRSREKSGSRSSSKRSKKKKQYNEFSYAYL